MFLLRKQNCHNYFNMICFLVNFIYLKFKLLLVQTSGLCVPPLLFQLYSNQECYYNYFYSVKYFLTLTNLNKKQNSLKQKDLDR